MVIPHGPNFQKLVDQVDYVKTASHSILTKLEYKIRNIALQQKTGGTGHVLKIWKVIREIIPEGEEDKLESTETNLTDRFGKPLSVKLSLYYDQTGNVFLSLTKEFRDSGGSVRTLSGKEMEMSADARISKSVGPPSLLTMFSMGNKNALFVPYTENIVRYGTGSASHTWNFPDAMKYIEKAKSQEITFFLFFAGVLDDRETHLTADDGLKIPNLSIKEINLLKDGLSLNLTDNKGPEVMINLGLGVINLTPWKVTVAEPHLTSGVKDSNWKTTIQPSSFEQFYARKTKFSPRGSVGLTILSVETNGGTQRFAVYWDIPFDRNLQRDNKYLLAALEGSEAETSQAAFTSLYSTSITNAVPVCQGSLRLELGDLLVSATMRERYRTRLQIVIIPANSLDSGRDQKRN